MPSPVEAHFWTSSDITFFLKFAIKCALSLQMYCSTYHVEGSFHYIKIVKLRWWLRKIISYFNTRCAGGTSIHSIGNRPCSSQCSLGLGQISQRKSEAYSPKGWYSNLLTSIIKLERRVGASVDSLFSIERLQAEPQLVIGGKHKIQITTLLLMNVIKINKLEISFSISDDWIIT